MATELKEKFTQFLDMMDFDRTQMVNYTGDLYFGTNREPVVKICVVLDRGRFVLHADISFLYGYFGYDGEQWIAVPKPAEL